MHNNLLIHDNAMKCKLFYLIQVAINLKMLIRCIDLPFASNDVVYKVGLSIAVLILLYQHRLWLPSKLLLWIYNL